MRLIDADKLKQDHFMSDECETCINDVGRCQNWHSYTKMDFCGWIDDAPTVDSVKHGKWIFNPKDAIEMMFTLPICSECGAKSSDGGNYCHNCGAKMDKVKNETN